MPLKYEENSPLEKPVALEKQPPAEQSGAAVEAHFAAAWRDKRTKRLLELLPQLPESATAETHKIIMSVALDGSIPKIGARGRLRRECFRRLSQSPVEVSLSLLKSSLFDDDPVIQELGFVIFQRAGLDALPAIRGMQPRLQTLNPCLSANQRGATFLVRLLGEMKSPQGTEILGDVLLGKAPRWRAREGVQRAFKDAMLCLLAGGGFGTLALVLLGAGLTWVLWATLGLAFMVCLIAFMVNVALVLLRFPLMAFVEDAAENRLIAETLAAMESVGDKNALYYLMQADSRSASKPTCAALIAKMLPLVEESDSERLGDVGTKWLLGRLGAIMPAQRAFPLLKAAEMLGDERLIGSVGRIISKSHQAEVQEEATRVLAVLEARRDAKQEKRELLRASDAPDDCNETLLRPLQDRRDPQEERELLRPKEKPESGG